MCCACFSFCRYLAAMAPSILLIKAGHEAASAPLSAATPGSSHEERMLGLLRPMLGALGEHLAQPPAAAAELPLRTEAIKQARRRRPFLLLHNSLRVTTRFLLH